MLLPMQFFRLRHGSQKKKRGRREALRVELLEKYKYLRIATEKKNEKPPKKVAHLASI
mgnify:FL=1